MNFLVVDGCNFVVGDKNSEKNHKRIIISSSLNYLSRQILNSKFKDLEIVVFSDCGSCPTQKTIVDVKGCFVKITYCSRDEGGADGHIVHFICEKQQNKRKKCQKIVGIVVTDDRDLKADIVTVLDGSIDIEIWSCQEFERQLNNQSAIP